MDPTGPGTMAQLLPWINGGGFAIIAALFVWLIRTEIPRREAAFSRERDGVVAVHAKTVETLTAAFRDEVRQEREERRLDRDACREEMHLIAASFEKMVVRLETRFAIDGVKKETRG